MAMTLERMRGPYVKLRKRLERAGYGYVMGAGAEPQVWWFENSKTGKTLYLVQLKGHRDWYTITKDWPRWVTRD